MNRNRQEKGITLIALVITIIVLLVLAGVTLSLIAGENGILKRAENANQRSFSATVQEKIEFAIAQIQIDFFENAKMFDRSQLTQSLLEKEDSNISNFETENFSGIYTWNHQEVMFVVNEDFTITLGEPPINGNTVSEVDDVKIWIECAGLQEKYRYGTMEQVLANENCLRELMNSKNAVDYMVRSTQIILPAVVGNQRAITILSQNEYAGYKVITKEESRKLVLESENVTYFDENSMSPQKMTNGEILCNDHTGADGRRFFTCI